MGCASSSNASYALPPPQRGRSVTKLPQPEYHYPPGAQTQYPQPLPPELPSYGGQQQQQGFPQQQQQQGFPQQYPQQGGQPPPQSFYPVQTFPPASAGIPISAQQLREPMLLLDTTGSMNYATDVNNPKKRLDTVREALHLLVPRLGEHDGEAEKEEDGGGLRTVTFADGVAFDLGDLSVSNLDAKFAQIHWHGSTWIMPGWTALLQVYLNEFGQRPPTERPLVLVAVISDGEAADIINFGFAMQQLPMGVYVAIGIVGFGVEHDNAMRSFLPIVNSQPRCRVVQVRSGPAGDTNAHQIADALENMFRAPLTTTGWA